MSPMMGAGMSPADRVSTPRPEEKKEEDNIPQFETREEAEEAFINMLKEQNVPAHLSWEQAMPRIVAFPMYRALKTLLERKQAFTRYAEDRRRTEREEQRARYTRDRETFRSMLSAIPEIKAGVKYRKALRWIRDKPEYISVASEKERQDFYEEYVEELRRAEMDQQRALRKRNVEKFRGILAKRGVTVSTRWKEAQAMYLEAPEYLEDEELKKMEPVDFLATFEDHIKALEEVESETKRRAENMRRRDERVKREAFWGLLQGLVEQGLLSTATKWKDIYPVIREDPRYLDMLGQPGSNPLEMFWDIQYDMEERFQTERKLVTDMMRVSCKISCLAYIIGDSFVFQSLNIVVNTDTSFTIFLAQFSDERINTVDKSILRMVFDEQMAKAEGRVKEEKRREERRLRKKLDSLKQALKKLDPPVTAESTWTEIQPRVAGKADVEGVSEEMQVEVFEKLRKKIEDKAPDSEEEGEEREKEERRKRRDRSEERGKRERSRSRDKRSRDRGREDRDRDRKSRRRHSRDRSVSEDERERERRKRRKVRVFVPDFRRTLLTIKSRHRRIRTTKSKREKSCNPARRPITWVPSNKEFIRRRWKVVIKIKC